MLRIENLRSQLNFTAETYSKIEVEKFHDKFIGIIHMNSPKDLNCLSN